MHLFLSSFPSFLLVRKSEQTSQDAYRYHHPPLPPLFTPPFTSSRSLDPHTKLKHEVYIPGIIVVPDSSRRDIHHGEARLGEAGLGWARL